MLHKSTNSVCSLVSDSNQMDMTDSYLFICFTLALNTFHSWCNKCRSIHYPVCGMMHIKYLLLLIVKSSPCSGGNRFPLLLSELSFTINMSDVI